MKGVKAGSHDDTTGGFNTCIGEGCNAPAAAPTPDRFVFGAAFGTFTQDVPPVFTASLLASSIGQLPDDWSALVALQELNMNGTQITGGRPELWRLLTSLSVLTLPN
eukprot:jgi/Tetstr1/462491/TSEL_007481.t1